MSAAEQVAVVAYRLAVACSGGDREEVARLAGLLAVRWVVAEAGGVTFADIRAARRC